MKNIPALMMAALLFLSCAPRQNMASAEAKRNIDKIRLLIGLSPEQVRQLTVVEAAYIQSARQLLTSDKGYEKKLLKLKNRRMQSFEKKLSREQFIKFKAIENDLIKKVPVYSEN